MPRIRPLRTVAATCTILLVTAFPAWAHAGVTPGEVEPDAEVTLQFRVPAERTSQTERVRILVPEEFDATACAGPETWTCELDTETHAPHVLATYTRSETLGQLSPPGVLFDLSVTAPPADDAGVYLMRVLQDYDDGHLAPWVFEGEPGPAPRLQVGDDETLRNGADAPGQPCFGPAEQPEEGGEFGPEQEPCPTTSTADADTTTDDDSAPAADDTDTNASVDSDSDASVDTDSDTDAAPASDDAESAAPASGEQLADTGGGAAILALGLTGIAATLRRRA